MKSCCGVNSNLLIQMPALISWPFLDQQFDLSLEEHHEVLVALYKFRIQLNNFHRILLNNYNSSDGHNY